ncbi:MAG: YgdI/YgdR family lipoprotein [Bacilli bacterium]|nr:YgdI/YgdR family lipoprotein [Bacilli bacterium]
MKKKIFVCLFALMMVFTLTACGSKNQTKDDRKEITIKDEGYGTTTLKYSKDKDYEVKEETGGKYKTIKVTSKKENFDLELYHTDTAIESYRAGKENRKSTKEFKEYTWNNYQGYSYDGSKYMINFNILLKDAEGNSKVLFGSMSYVDYKEANVTELFKSEDFQNLLNSISFTE